MKLFVDLALTYLHIPYLWGGSNFAGLDCSGLLQLLLSHYGIDLPGDQTAQGLYNHFSKNSVSKEIQMGALVFFGKDTKHVTHCAAMLDKYKLIEAGGGDRSTTTVKRAIEQNAQVRVRALTDSKYRTDIVGIFMPDYPNAEY